MEERLYASVRRRVLMLMSVEPMTPDIERALKLAYPGEDARYFSPMAVGSTPATADEGAAAILDGIKTTTSSGFWDWPDGRIPFVGALWFCWTGKAVCARS